MYIYIAYIYIYIVYIIIVYYCILLLYIMYIMCIMCISNCQFMWFETSSSFGNGWHATFRLRMTSYGDHQRLRVPSPNSAAGPLRNLFVNGLVGKISPETLIQPSLVGFSPYPKNDGVLVTVGMMKFPYMTWKVIIHSWKPSHQPAINIPLPEA